MARFQKTPCSEKVENIGTARIVARARAHVKASLEGERAALRRVK